MINQFHRRLVLFRRRYWLAITFTFIVFIGVGTLIISRANKSEHPVSVSTPEPKLANPPVTTSTQTLVPTLPPVKTIEIPLPTRTIIPPTPSPTPRVLSKEELIMDAFMRQWLIYKEKAWPNYYLPVSNKIKSEVNASITMCEALTTLILMGFENEYKDILEYLSLFFHPNGTMSVRDFVPSVIGGIASSIDLLENSELLYVINDLYRNFPRIESPDMYIYPRITFPSTYPQGISYGENDTLLTHDQGTVQLELFSVHKRAKRKNPMLIPAQYIKTFQYILSSQTAMPVPNSFLLSLEPASGASTTFSEHGESIYHSLVKTHRFTNKTAPSLKDLIHKFVSSTMDNYFDKSANMVKHSIESREMLIDDIFIATIFLKLNEIFPGIESVFPEIKSAPDIMKNVIKMIHDYTLPPKTFWSHGPNDRTFQFSPNLFEALYVFWTTTKDEIYKDAMWELFVNFNKTCWTENGYTDVVLNPDGSVQHLDSLNPTIYSAAFKYLFLTFTNGEMPDFSGWEFNSHGHPLRPGVFTEELIPLLAGGDNIGDIFRL